MCGALHDISISYQHMNNLARAYSFNDRFFEGSQHVRWAAACHMKQNFGLIFHLIHGTMRR